MIEWVVILFIIAIVLSIAAYVLDCEVPSWLYLEIKDGIIPCVKGTAILAWLGLFILGILLSFKLILVG